MMQIVGFIFTLVILLNNTVLGDIKDFIISNEDDLQRLSEKNDMIAETDDYDEEIYYEGDSSMMYDQCGYGDGVVDETQNFVHDEEVTIDDFNMLSEENSISQKYAPNGRVDLAMLRKAIQKLTTDPKIAAALERAYMQNNVHEYSDSHAMCSS